MESGVAAVVSNGLKMLSNPAVDPYDKLSRFLLFQRHSIVKDFRDKMATCLIAVTPEGLLLNAKLLGWSVTGAKHIRPTSALVITKPHSEPELWVRHSYRGYRLAFLWYLRAYYGITASALSSNWQIDHLHPSSRFTPEHEYFVRLALVDRRINASYGAGLERLLYERERARELSGEIHMDWMAFLKARGTSLPRKTQDIEDWQIWAWSLAKELASERFDPILTYVGLTTMLNLAYVNTWAPFSFHPSFREEARTFEAWAYVPYLFETSTDS